MMANKKNSSLSSETSISQLMEPELHLHPVGLIIYVQFYRQNTVLIQWFDQEPPKAYSGGFTRVFIPNQCAFQEKARGEARSA